MVETARAPRGGLRSSAMVEIDGAHGEGGGQLVRMAVAIAAMKGVPVRIVNVRARRRRPGLAAQHAAAVQAVAALCDARCDGAQPGSGTVTFSPQRLRGGSFRVDVGTAGSIALVLQAMLPAALAARAPVEVALHGGTDVPRAPPVDYLRLVLLPVLATMGVRCELEITRRGYYPRGGGELRFRLQPPARLAPFVVMTPGAVERVDLRAHVDRLPLHVAHRMVAAARDALRPGMLLAVAVDAGAPGLALGPGGGITLRARCAHTVLGAAEVAERGVRAERIGALAGHALQRDLDAGATLDAHAADQMLIFLAMADGPSAYRCATLSSHAGTVMWLLQTLTAARFGVASDDAGVRVHVQPDPGFARHGGARQSGARS